MLPMREKNTYKHKESTNMWNASKKPSLSLCLWSKDSNFRMQPQSFMWLLSLETQLTLCRCLTSPLFPQHMTHFFFPHSQKPSSAIAIELPKTLSALACPFFRSSSSQANNSRCFNYYISKKSRNIF